MLEFSWAGSLALLALAMCWSLAIVLFRVGATGSVARQLSLLNHLRDSLEIVPADAEALENDLVQRAKLA